MEELPPSYGSLFTGNGSGLSYLDFMPDCIKQGGIFTKPEYVNFRHMIDRANEWLRFNTQWEIKTCESVEFKDYRGGIDPTGMLYTEYAQSAARYVRGLRLWLKPLPPGEGKVQQIGYANLVPQTTVPGGVFTSTQYESLDDVLLRFNTTSRTSPLPGRIITIETQEMKVSSDNEIDPDRSGWTEFEKRRTCFLFIIRIFFEIGEPHYQEIGVTDFVPEMTSTSCLGALSKAEPFSALVHKATDWLSRQTGLKVINIQSVVTKFKDVPNTKKMSYIEHGGKVATFFLRTLRIAHVRLQGGSSPVQLSCKTFVPRMIESGKCSNCYVPDFETLQETMKKVSTWLQSSGVEVISMETSAIRLFRKTASHSAEKTFFYDAGNQAEYYLFVIRAYLNGTYRETYEEDSSTPIVECCTIL